MKEFSNTTSAHQKLSSYVSNENIFFFKVTYIELPSEIHHFVSRANGRALMGEEVAMKTENGLDEKDLVGHED